MSFISPPFVADFNPFFFLIISLCSTVWRNGSNDVMDIAREHVFNESNKGIQKIRQKRTEINIRFTFVNVNFIVSHFIGILKSFS